jgi:hypothetical protein
VQGKAEEKVDGKVDEKVHAAAVIISHAVTANPDVPAVAAIPARSRRHRRRSHLQQLPPLRARLRSAVPLHRKLRPNHRQNLPIIRIFRRSCYDPFAPASDESVFERKPAPDLIRGGHRFA